jgi:hypothetical protein
LSLKVITAWFFFLSVYIYLSQYLSQVLAIFHRPRFQQGFLRDHIKVQKILVRFLRNLMESLLRRLQAISWTGQSFSVPAKGALHTMGPFQGKNL